MQMNTLFYNTHSIQIKKGSNFIMKTMKKIFALALAMMMVFSLALSANAANLTVDGALEGAEYNIYKIAAVTVETSGAVVYTAEADWVDFLKDLEWIDFFEGDTSMNFVRKGDPSEADMITAAKLAKEHAAKEGIEATDTQTADETPVASFTDVADGYYLMTSDKGSLCTLATITEDDDKIKEKNKTLPNVTKTVDDEDVAIGDTVSFTLTVITGENHENEMNYVIHDTMTKGLTLDETSIVVKHGTKVLTKGTDYTVTTGCADGCAFEIIFKETLTTAAYDIITVTYDATVATDINVSATNTAKIEDSTSSVTVITTEFTLEKTDGEGEELAGAKFELYYATVTGEGESATTNYTKVPVVKDGDAYRPAVGTETVVEIEAGTATVKGLDPELTYYVKETKAPTGYVKIDGYNVVAEGTVTVVNVKGDELPETGGMGTTLFYAVGGLMVAAAAVLMVLKKRQNAM